MEPQYPIDKSTPRYAGRTIRVKRLSDKAIISTRANSCDAGWDLYASKPRGLAPDQRAMFCTDISFEIPEGFDGLIWPRSGLSVKKGVDVLAGVVDSGYRGEVKVCLLNTGHEWLEVEEGDRIAQILFQEVPEFQLQEVDVLQNSDRGVGGFGSSGK